MDLTYLDDTRMQVTYEIPLSEVIYNFFDKLKSYSKGYATLDYSFSEYKASNLVKMDILLNGQPVDALSLIVYRPTAYNRGVAMCRALKNIIPRQQYEVPIQAAINNKIMPARTLKPYVRMF